MSKYCGSFFCITNHFWNFFTLTLTIGLFSEKSFNQLLFGPKLTGFPGNLGQYTSSRLIDLRQSLYMVTFVCLKKEAYLHGTAELLNRSFCLIKFADDEIHLKVHKSRSNQTIVYGSCPRDPRWPRCHYRRNYELWQWIIMNEWMSYNSFQFFDGYETLKKTAGVI